MVKDATINESSVDKEKSLSAISDLNKIEKDILYAMRIAEETLLELSILTDDCSYERIEALSTAYISLIENIRSKFKSHSNLLHHNSKETGVVNSLLEEKAEEINAGLKLSSIANVPILKDIQ